MVQLQNSVFNSFWMAGFECTDQLNATGHRVDFLNLTGHLDMLQADYLQLEQFNMATVREGIRWSQVEKTPYVYDWSTVARMMDTAKRLNIQQVWDLCHFGFPDDLTPLHPMFTKRFSALCKSFVEFYRSKCPYDRLIVVPINEVSFLSWLGGDASGTVPYCKGYGWEVKYNLMKAYIEGIEAIKAVDDSVCILTSEPLINRVPPLQATAAEIAAANELHEHQFQVLDILCGKICPELRGKPEYVDYIGLNYYYNNQWIYNSCATLCWKEQPKNIRWRPLASLVEEVYQRYGKPIIITETSHPKEDRPLWIKDITTQLIEMFQKNIPLMGVCIYPVIDRPDWDDLITWHHSGIWDIEYENCIPKRVLYEPYAAALLQSQRLLENVVTSSSFNKAVSELY